MNGQKMGKTPAHVYRRQIRQLQKALELYKAKHENQLHWNITVRKQLQEATRLTPQDRADLAKARMDRTFALNEKLKAIGVSLFGSTTPKISQEGDK